ncbi:MULTISPECIES: ATP-dependent DNA helicase UvrD2 [unclassified Brevibacterium]|uniref:ATP-dependent DNA helicase UvrD2 n=1 Tax=unclassified Brevibacterium TaxID=2614124 RepID=UPI000A4ADC0E|nr:MULTISPECIES: ATP-dependent DNA helicase UvrD2 [unclassified Brevibacterium]
MTSNAVTSKAAQLLEALDTEQRAVAEHSGGPLVVLAGAGTGKTRAMTHRIAYGALTGQRDPKQTLALTFTAKAAGEMRSRLRSLGVAGAQARTFHAAALRQLRYFWPMFAEGPFPELMPNKAGSVARVMGNLGLTVERELVRDVAAEIEYAAVSLLGIDEYAQQAHSRELPGGLSASAIVDIMRGYSDLKTERRLLDFEDVLLTLSGVLGTRADLVATVHSQYRHFVVDEFQDVSPLQYDLLMRWLGDRDSLCVVGDPAQTIYTFAGATSNYLLSTAQRFAGTTTIELVRNYRSRASIVEAANKVLSHTGSGALQLQPVREGGQPPSASEYADDASEAAAAAQRIQAQIAQGVRASDIAVLFRTNGQSRAVEEALEARGISYVLRGGERFFARREVKEAMVLLRSSAAARRTERLDTAVAEVLSSIGWQAQPPSATGALREKWESLNSLVQLASDMQRNSQLPITLPQFSAELEDRREHQFAPTVDGVTLASVHAAKGLEWSCVHLIGLTEGLMPISYAQTPRDIAEERRLFYVAVTRARDSLDLSWARMRQSGSRTQRRVSRFVAEMRGAQAVRREDAPRSTVVSRACRQCGKALSEPADRRMGRCASCASPADSGLLSELSRWRAAKAEELRVPEYMVLTQATLSALAEAMPGNRDQLALIPGLGSVKLAQFGSELLDITAAASGVASEP